MSHNTPKISDIIGSKHNLLTIKESVGSYKKKRLVLCRCDCGQEKIIILSKVLSNKTKSCGCLRRKQKELRYDWRGYGEITGRQFYKIKVYATKEFRTKEIEFDITIEYIWRLFLQQDRKCALSNIPLVMNYGTKGHSASLDRIDSSKGYVEGNVQWVHKDINRMKWAHDQQYFLYLCNKICEFHQKDTK